MFVSSRTRQSFTALSLGLAASTARTRQPASRFAQGCGRVAPVTRVAVALLLPCATIAGAQEPTSHEAPNALPYATLAVTNCNDSGAGSLRDVVASAASGDTLIIKPRACNDIRLTGGAIFIAQDNLTLIGPGPDALLVSGNRTSQVFRHGGGGTLRISGMSIGYGRRRGAAARGGCIQSNGSLQLKAVHVHHCLAQGTAGSVFPSATGGGIYAVGDVSLVGTVVRANRADAAADARGGGLYAGGRLTMTRSQVRNNATSGGDGGGVGGALVYGTFHAYYSEISGNQAGFIGGVAAYGEVVLAHSSIANNQAGVLVGGAVLGGENVGVLIVDSTISGNAAATLGGLSLGPHTTLSNTTVAFNRELTTDPGACEGGLRFPIRIHLESTIVARNACNGRPLDITAQPDARPVIGADNLVELSTVPLPPDTISANPGLMPLANNGGPTRTHALRPDSPAINRGNNVAGLHFDQRGRGFPRVNGPRADIGAYESPASP